MGIISDRELIKVCDEATINFAGDLTELERAIGVLVIGRHFGWKPLFLIHERRTIKKYEKILGVEFRDVLREEGPRAEKSIAWLAAKKITNFWKAVRGEIAGIRTPVIKR